MLLTLESMVNVLVGPLRVAGGHDDKVFAKGELYTD